MVGCQLAPWGMHAEAAWQVAGSTGKQRLLTEEMVLPPRLTRVLASSIACTTPSLPWNLTIAQQGQRQCHAGVAQALAGELAEADSPGELRRQRCEGHQDHLRMAGARAPSPTSPAHCS